MQGTKRAVYTPICNAGIQTGSGYVLSFRIPHRALHSEDNANTGCKSKESFIKVKHTQDASTTQLGKLGQEKERGERRRGR